MTMGPWWCSRESKGLRLLSRLRLSRRFRRRIVGAAIFLVGMRRPRRMVAGVFAAFDGRALPRLIRVRGLFRALRSGICDRGQPLRASGLSATAWPYPGGSFPNSSARAWLPDLFILPPHMVDSVAFGWESFVRGALLAGCCWRDSTQENWILGTHLHAGFRFSGGRRRKLRGLSPRRSCSRRLRGRGRNT